MAAAFTNIDLKAVFRVGSLTQPRLGSQPIDWEAVAAYMISSRLVPDRLSTRLVT